MGTDESEQDLFSDYGGIDHGRAERDEEPAVIDIELSLPTPMFSPHFQDYDNFTQPSRTEVVLLSKPEKKGARALFRAVAYAAGSGP